jgi:tRNA dimethylallyltransferase
LEENVSPFYIGLKAPRDVLHQQIKKRTNKRLKQGIEKEIQNLLKEGVVWRDQAMNSLGYKQWKLYLDGKSTKEEVIAQWQREEFKYAKRQMVWFKSNRDINWFDISKENWRKGVEKLVKEWYKSE